MKQISVDIGGTFTDCFVLWDDRHIEAKALTTHHNLGEGFLDAVANAAEQLGLTTDDILAGVESVRYATTLGTNSLIERNGARLGLIVTRGFEDTVALGRGVQYGDGLSDAAKSNLPAADRPEPLVERLLTVGVRERVDFRGEILVPIDEADVRRQVRTLIERGARGFVVVLTNSVVNAEHEKLVARVIADEYPSSLLGAYPVVCSHEVSQRKGEYRRAMSTIINAYLHREMQYALQSLQRALRERGYRKPMQIVHNSGGMAQLTRTHALQTVHAGPVAGLSAAEQVSKQLGLDNLVCVDMGGTSFDIGLVTGGGVRHYQFEPVIDRWRVDVPMVDVTVLGAGGGSIARYDPTFHAVEVGPESAGSDPGPACFNMGGRRPTVTDANLVLGYIDPDRYFGGRFTLDVRRAKRALLEHVGKPLGLTAEEAAAAVRQVVDSRMANAIFTKVALKGHDPRDFVVFAYGGNSPVHACGFSAGLGAKKVVVPNRGPIFSAFGAGAMPYMSIQERSTSIAMFDAQGERLYDDLDALNALIDELADNGRREIRLQGIPDDRIEQRVELDLRYGDQLQLLSMESPVSRFTDQRDVLAAVKSFHSAYGERFGEHTQTPEAGIRLNLIRVVTSARSEDLPLAPSDTTVDLDTPPRPVATRSAWFPGEGTVDTPVFEMDDLAVGVHIDGPALVVSPHTTFVVNPGWTLQKQPTHTELHREDER
ncbi:hydantoinase/oxoprolinase family protein [Gordonia terrae]